MNGPLLIGSLNDEHLAELHRAREETRLIARAERTLPPNHDTRRRLWLRQLLQVWLRAAGRVAQVKPG